MLISAILHEKGGDVISAKADAPITDIVAILKDRGIGAVLILGDQQEVQGVLSERDITRALAIHGAKILTLLAEDLMTRDVIHCAPDQDLRGAMTVMTNNRIRHLPVVENGTLMGLVSIGDLVKYRILEAEGEAEALRGYIATG